MKPAHILLLSILLTMIPVNGQTEPREIKAEWEQQVNESLAGFRLYKDNDPVCETTDPTATSLTCNVDAPDGESFFTLTAFYQDDYESPHSDPFSYIFSSELKAIFTADSISGESPLFVSFDATSSTGNIVTFEWMFGDGYTETGNIVNHTFTTAGNYTVTLKVTDDSGAFDQETVSVTVTNPSAINDPPSAAVSSSVSVGDAPLEIHFDGSGSMDTDGSIVSYMWDMGDGTQMFGQQITYTYSSAGTFNATLTVTDDGGLTDSASTPVIVSEPAESVNKPPKASIKASTSKGFIPLNVTFDASNSKDPDGEITTYTWNFGDGSNGTGMYAQHTFSQPAVYSVTLKVTDNLGASSQLASFVVTVQEPSEIPGPDPEKIKYLLHAINHLLLTPKVVIEPPEQDEQNNSP